MLIWTIIVGGGLLPLTALLLAVAPFGNERQSGISLRILTVGGQALGGGGFVLLAVFGISRLLQR